MFLLYIKTTPGLNTNTNATLFQIQLCLAYVPFILCIGIVSTSCLMLLSVMQEEYRILSGYLHAPSSYDSVEDRARQRGLVSLFSRFDRWCK